jgi:hypothetical protein
MAENEQTKICPLCAEAIKAAAKVCPYCRKSQNRRFFISKYDLIAFVSAALVIGMILMFLYLFVGPRNYSPNRDQIEVLNSQRIIEKAEYSTNLVVFGVLTNKSPYAWQIGGFEVRYYSKDGKIADLSLCGDEFTVLPHSDHSYRLMVYDQKTIPDYPSYKVFVSSAKDPKIW